MVWTRRARREDVVSRRKAARFTSGSCTVASATSAGPTWGDEDVEVAFRVCPSHGRRAAGTTATGSRGSASATAATGESGPATATVTPAVCAFAS